MSKDNYIVKMSWDRRKRPTKLVVSVKPRFWDLIPADKKSQLSEVKDAVKMWMDEIKAQT